MPINPFRGPAGAFKAGAQKLGGVVPPHVSAGLGAGAIGAAPLAYYNMQGQEPAAPAQAAPRIGVPGPAEPPVRVVPPPPVPTATPAMPIAGNTDDHAQLRQTILGDLHGQMLKAQQAGDRDSLYDLAAQRGALDNGGFQGLARYRQDAADAKAQREHLSAKDNPRFAGLSPDEVWQQAMMKTGNEQVADAMAQRARIGQADAQAKASGKPAQVLPTDAAAVLQMKYPSAFAEFTQEDGTNKHNIEDLYSALTSLNIPGFSDPNSEFSQAAKHHIAQVYGSDLAGQLQMPTRMADIPEGMGLNRYFGNAITNVLNGQWTLQPDAAWEAKAPAVQWFQKINGTPAP